MEQSGKDWLIWRKQGITSTDAPVIMGVSPYKSKLQLFNEKISDEVIEEEKYIFKLGHKIEKQARAIYEIQEQIDFGPCIFERIDFDFLKASMDGANVEHKRGIEIKLVGKDEFEAGICPKRYYPQIQHQYLVTDFDRIDLILVLKGKGSEIKIKVIEVQKDIEYIRDLVFAEFDFYFKNLIPKIAPSPMIMDAKKADKILSGLVKKRMMLMSKRDKCHDDAKKYMKQIRDIEIEVSNRFKTGLYKHGKSTVVILEDGFYVNKHRWER